MSSFSSVVVWLGFTYDLPFYIEMLLLVFQFPDMFAKFGVLSLVFITEAVFVPIVSLTSFLELIFCSADLCFWFFAAVARGHGCSVYHGFREALAVQWAFVGLSAVACF